MACVSFQVLLAAYAGCVATLCIPGTDYSSGYGGVLAFIGFAALAVLCIPQSAIPLCATAIASLLASFFSPAAAVAILSSVSGCLLYLHRPRFLPAQWAALFPDLRLVDPWSPLKPEFLSCIKAAFQGSAGTSPEGCLDWAFAGPNNEPRDKHCGKLGADPSDARKDYFGYSIDWCFQNLGALGGCLALVDSNGAVVGGAICCPADQTRHRWMEVARNICALGLPPAAFMASEKRVAALDKTMRTGHEKWAAGRHWYVQCFAAHPKHQGQGHGKRLLEVLTTIADLDQAEIYLETVGDGNVGFYSKKAYFEVKERCSVVEPESKDTFNEDGGMTFMVREPRPVQSAKKFVNSLN